MVMDYFNWIGSGFWPWPPLNILHYITLHYITLSSFHTPFASKLTSVASTKLCMSGIICKCRQMSFQLLFERTSVGKFLETKRKVIRSFRSFFHRTFASIIEVRFEECSQIWVFLDQTDVHQMHEYAQFENYAKQLEASADSVAGSDVFSCSGDESGSLILDTLQWIDWRLRECCRNGVAVIHSGCYKSRYQTRRDIGTEDSTDGLRRRRWKSWHEQRCWCGVPWRARCSSTPPDREPHWLAWWCLVQCRDWDQDQWFSSDLSLIRTRSAQSLSDSAGAFLNCTMPGWLWCSSGGWILVALLGILMNVKCAISCVSSAYMWWPRRCSLISFAKSSIVIFHFSTVF